MPFGLNVMCSKQYGWYFREFTLIQEYQIAIITSRIHITNSYYTIVRVKICSTVPEVYKDLLGYEKHLSRLHSLCHYSGPA